MIQEIRSTVRQSFYYGIGNIAVKLVGLILIPLYSRKFPIEQYGLLTLLEIVAEIIIALSSMGIMGGFNRWYWDDEGKCKQKSLFFTILIFSIISTTIFILISSWIVYNYSSQIFDTQINMQLLIVFMANIFLRVVISRSLMLMQIKQLVIKQTKYVLLNMMTVLITTLFFILVLNKSLIGVFGGQICGNLLVLIIILPFIIDECEPKYDKPLLKKMFNYSLPLAISSVMTIVMTLSDRFILKHYYSLVDVGQYSLAYKISNLIKLLLIRSFVKSYSYKYYKNINEEKQAKFFYKSVSYFTFTTMYSGILLCVISGLIIKVLLDNADYSDSLSIVPYLVIGIVLEGIRTILTMPQMKLKNTVFVSAVSIGSGLLNIILNLIIIPRYGAIGAAVTTAISKGVALIFYLWQNSKAGFKNYEIIKYIKIIVIGIAMLYLWLNIPDCSFVLKLAADLVILLLYPIILYLSGTFEKSEVFRIKQFITKWTKSENFITLFKKK